MHPGEQVAGQGDEFGPDLVVGRLVQGKVAQAGVLGAADAVLGAGSASVAKFQECVNLQAQILQCMTRLGALEARARTAEEITMIGIALVLADLAATRAEMRQDLAALGDELAALRRHMDDHLSAISSELLHRHVN